jgi:membrane protease subunit HflK
MARKTINVGGEIVELPEMPKIPKVWLLAGTIGLAALILVFTAFYTIAPNEKGVIQRFGKYVRTTDSGLHFKLPFGIETVRKVPVEDRLKEEFGFRTAAPAVRTRFATGDFSGESLMLTGDLNSALVEWIVQYRIKDPVQFSFNVRNVRETLRDVCESVMRQVVGDRSVDEVIVLGRQEIEDEAQQLTQSVLDEYETGLKVVNIRLQDVVPPEPVQPAFNEVNQARQEKESIINAALAAYNQVIPQAEGQAKQTITEAEGYALNRVNRSRGDADRFLSIWREYSKAKDVTRRRMYLETMLDILPKLDNIYVVDEQQDGLIPLLQLQRKEVASK